MGGLSYTYRAPLGYVRGGYTAIARTRMEGGGRVGGICQYRARV